MTNLAQAFHEEAHARLSPSGSKKWFACPGSITLEESIPNVPTSYSDAGTAMHEIAARCLTQNELALTYVDEFVVVSLSHEPVRKVRFTEDMADLTQGYVDTMRFKSNGLSHWVEQRVNFSEFCGVPNQFGTADFITLDVEEGVLSIDDLKSGYTPVSVEKNSQLMCYALGALAMVTNPYVPVGAPSDVFHFARLIGIKTIVLGVYQPRVGGHSEYSMPLKELEAFAALLRSKAASVENAKRDYGVVPIKEWNKVYLNQTPNDEECAFCRAMPTCPSATNKLQEFMMDGFDRIIDGEVPPPAENLPQLLKLPQARRLELLNTLMKLAPFVEDMIIAVRAEAERVLLTGEDIPDFGLETGRMGARKFRDEEEAETLLSKTMRLKRELICNFTIKTPTQLEKLTKPAKDDLTGLETPPVLGETRWKRVQALVVQADPKPSVKLKKLIKKPYVPPKPSTEGFEPIADDEQLF